MQYKQPIFVTGVERSGSTLVTRVLQICGAHVGKVNKMRENKKLLHFNTSFIKKHSSGCFMPDLSKLSDAYVFEKTSNIVYLLEEEKMTDKMPFLFKASSLAQMWSLWHTAYPQAKWIIVRRRTGDIIHSCVETAYMTKFKDKDNQKLVGAKNEMEGWLWWVHQYEARFVEMVENLDSNVMIVWPERMRDNNFLQMQEMVKWCGLEWKPSVVPIMKRLLK